MYSKYIMPVFETVKIYLLLSLLLSVPYLAVDYRIFFHILLSYNLILAKDINLEEIFHKCDNFHVLVCTNLYASVIKLPNLGLIRISVTARGNFG